MIIWPIHQIMGSNGAGKSDLGRRRLAWRLSELWLRSAERRNGEFDHGYGNL